MSSTVDFTKFTARQILTALVEGLRKPYYKVNMSTYGSIDYELIENNTYSAICYACAASNAITSLTHIKYNPSNINHREKAFKDKDINLLGNLANFEIALDRLRKGYLFAYNNNPYFAKIINPREITLPYLTDDYTEEDLLVYESLIEDQIPD